MKVKRSFHEEAVYEPINFPSANITVNTVSTGVPEDVRIGSQWIESAKSQLEQRELALEEKKDNVKFVSISLDKENNKNFKRKRRTLFVALFIFIGFLLLTASLAAVFLLRNEINENNESVNSKADQKDKVEFFSTDEDVIEFICQNLTAHQNLFTSNDSQPPPLFLFAVCLNNDDILICETEGGDVQDENCGRRGGSCNCTAGQFFDLRSFTSPDLDERDLCSSGNVDLSCVSLENDPAIHLQPIADTIIALV